MAGNQAIEAAGTAPMDQATLDALLLDATGAPDAVEEETAPAAGKAPVAAEEPAAPEEESTIVDPDAKVEGTIVDPASKKAVEKRRIEITGRDGKVTDVVESKEEFMARTGATEALWNKFPVAKETNRGWSNEFILSYSGFGKTGYVENSFGNDPEYAVRGLHVIEARYGGRYLIPIGKKDMYLGIGFNAGIKLGVTEETKPDGMTIALPREYIVGLSLAAVLDIHFHKNVYLVLGLEMSGYVNQLDTFDMGDPTLLSFSPNIGIGVLFNPDDAVVVGMELVYMRDILAKTEYSAVGDSSAYGVGYGGDMGPNRVEGRFILKF